MNATTRNLLDYSSDSSSGYSTSGVSKLGGKKSKGKGSAPSAKQFHREIVAETKQGIADAQINTKNIDGFIAGSMVYDTSGNFLGVIASSSDDDGWGGTSIFDLERKKR